VPFVISTDSHATQEFDALPYGVAQARRGWLGPADVLNTREAEEFLAALRRPAV
jgi:DNA polymerase (family 10)